VAGGGEGVRQAAGEGAAGGGRGHVAGGGDGARPAAEKQRMPAAGEVAWLARRRGRSTWPSGGGDPGRYGGRLGTMASGCDFSEVGSVRLGFYGGSGPYRAGRL
jgi:hypothetical protein